jgi:urease gamma subunit
VNYIAALLDGKTEVLCSPMRVALIAFALVLAAAGAALATPAAKPLALSARVLRSGEFQGFKPAQTTQFRRVRDWITDDTGLTRSQVAARTVRLKRAGFVALLSEHLMATSGVRDRAAVSWVMRLGSAQAARREVTAAVRDAMADGKERGHRYVAFSVEGIRGARGFRLTSPGSAGDNVMFADGPFVYLVGTKWDPFTRRPPPRANLVAAARTLYKRVRGHPPA